MKKILGLDLGTTSIGWCVVLETDQNQEIQGMGSRIISLATDEKDEFSQGNQISKNQKRTARRTQRKGYDRYQLRRKELTKQLLSLNMLPDEVLFKLEPLKLWELRAKAVTEKVDLKELGRILYHLNQKRGYKSSRSDANLDKKDTEYVAAVKGRHQEIKDAGTTIGQRFYNELCKDSNYRIRQQVYPREAYIEEFEAICKEQQKHYPDLLTDSLIDRIRNEIIYYQRALKSQKGLINVCEFAGFNKKNKQGKNVFVGPRVSPKSSPLFQYCKIWEAVNTISLKRRNGEIKSLTLDEKKKLVNHLDNNPRLTASDLFKILGLDKSEGWYYSKQLERGIQGNTTKVELMKVIEKNSELLQFNLEKDELLFVDKETGEINNLRKNFIIAENFEKLPLYKLWHTIYSISDTELCNNALIKNFDLDADTAAQLADIDFRKSGFGNKSAKAMRKIIPYLEEGYVYSDACALAGFNHSGSLTKDQNLQRQLLDKLPLLKKNSLRQPVVEKILNQLINVVNAIIEKYGRPDEIRVELARELKQSKEERNETFRSLKQRERENEVIRKRLVDEYRIRATRNNVIKYRLFHEINNDDNKVNAFCIYCGKPFGIADALSGDNVDIEHIIPKSLLFDDSQSNKTLSHRHCNEAKGNRTAYDFMVGKGQNALDDYLHRIESLSKARVIGRAKRDKLLMTQSKIPKDFIDRQLRESQYISRKSKEILSQVCYNVWSTSGNVTEYLRRLWGWDDVLHNLQFPLHKEHGLTEMVEWEANGQQHTKEVIKDWTKRNDHRHHAIDALVIACTRQGFIQRINNLSSQGNRDAMYEHVNNTPFEFRDNLNLLEKYLISHKPFTTHEVEEKAAEILVSFKAGKKVATLGRRLAKVKGKEKVVQTGIIVPRGPLSEESVYGKVKTLSIDFKTGEPIKYPVKYLLEHPHLIIKPLLREKIEERLSQFQGDVKAALKSIKMNPIFLDKDNTLELTYASCFSEEYVMKYPLSSIKPADVIYIVDKFIQKLVRQRFEQYKGKEKEAFNEPLWYDASKTKVINSVRLFTGLSAVEPVKYNTEGKPIGFVKPGNNHHIAFYTDEDGKIHEHVCTFWQAVERKRFGLPIIIKDTKAAWDSIISQNLGLPDSFLKKLPLDSWVYNESLQQNEMFIMGLDEDVALEAVMSNNKDIISRNLYRVQKITSSDYFFRHHLETMVDNATEGKTLKKFLRIRSITDLNSYNPTKVNINNLGDFRFGWV